MTLPSSPKQCLCLSTHRHFLISSGSSSIYAFFDTGIFFGPVTEILVSHTAQCFRTMPISSNLIPHKPPEVPYNGLQPLAVASSDQLPDNINKVRITDPQPHPIPAGQYSSRTQIQEPPPVSIWSFPPTSWALRRSGRASSSSYGSRMAPGTTTIPSNSAMCPKKIQTRLSTTLF
jgi:hypothetical protein